MLDDASGGTVAGNEVSSTDEAGMSGDDMEALRLSSLAWRTLAQFLEICLL
ncbi:hypothetical protein ACNKHK_10625 [Shigella flexneri]